MNIFFVSVINIISALDACQVSILLALGARHVSIIEEVVDTPRGSALIDLGTRLNVPVFTVL